MKNILYSLTMILMVVSTLQNSHSQQVSKIISWAALNKSFDDVTKTTGAKQGQTLKIQLLREESGKVSILQMKKDGAKQSDSPSACKQDCLEGTFGMDNATYEDYASLEKSLSQVYRLVNAGGGKEIITFIDPFGDVKVTKKNMGPVSIEIPLKNVYHKVNLPDFLNTLFEKIKSDKAFRSMGIAKDIEAARGNLSNIKAQPEGDKNRSKSKKSGGTYRCSFKRSNVIPEITGSNTPLKKPYEETTCSYSTNW